jgi:hypothetical protein
MRRSWLRLCAGTSIVGAALVLGCQHGHKKGEPCSSCGATVAATDLKAVPVSSYAPIKEEPVVVTNELPSIPEAKALPAPVAETTVEQTNFIKPAPEDDHSKIRRRSFADISADPCFAHSADYTSLTGELCYLKARNCWTVRFASVDDEDRYGGSVTLADLGTMNEFHAGQMVQVQGHMADVDSHEPAPKFQVQSMHVVK